MVLNWDDSVRAIEDRLESKQRQWLRLNHRAQEEYSMLQQQRPYLTESQRDEFENGIFAIYDEMGDIRREMNALENTLLYAIEEEKRREHTRSR
jgi:hypothetical protein